MKKDELDESVHGWEEEIKLRKTRKADYFLLWLGRINKDFWLRQRKNR